MGNLSYPSALDILPDQHTRCDHLRIENRGLILNAQLRLSFFKSNEIEKRSIIISLVTFQDDLLFSDDNLTRRYKVCAKKVKKDLFQYRGKQRSSKFKPNLNVGDAFKIETYKFAYQRY